MSEAIARQLAHMLGSEVGIGWSEVGDEAGLLPEEAPAVARAVPKRRAEFAAGRRAARAAMQNVGQPVAAIPVGASRAPLWPKGLFGAITHDAGLALAAVTRARISVGIDLTEAAPLPGDTGRAILPHAGEQGLSPLEERAIFSAKESLFKALSPFVGTFFGFGAAMVQPDLETGVFTVTLKEPVGDFQSGRHWSGCVSVHGSSMTTALTVPV